MPKLIMLDVESTGRDEEDRLCEVAYKVDGESKVYTERFKPPVPIKYEAMAVHHITEEAIKDHPPFINSSLFDEMRFWFNGEHSIMVAHNAKFDADMLKKEGIETPNVICTMKCVRQMDKKMKLSNYKLQYLRYRLGLKMDDGERRQSHNAEDDVIVLEALYNWLLESGLTVEDMLKITAEPHLMRRIPFGKHKDDNILDIPYSYWCWLSDQDDLDEDLRFTVDYHMRRLGGK